MRYVVNAMITMACLLLITASPVNAQVKAYTKRVTLGCASKEDLLKLMDYAGRNKTEFQKLIDSNRCSYLKENVPWLITSRDINLVRLTSEDGTLSVWTTFDAVD